MTVTAPPVVAVFDTETTGFKPSQGARLLEIAVVRLDSSGREVRRWSTLVNPGDSVPLGAQDIHLIDRSMLADAPTFAEVIGDFIEMVEGSMLVAHNTPFDLAFLESEFAHAGHAWPGPVTGDTLKAARTLLPGLRSYKLGDLASHLGIPFEGMAHSALADAAVTADLYRRLLAMTGPVRWADTTSVTWPAVPASGKAKTR